MTSGDVFDAPQPREWMFDLAKFTPELAEKILQELVAQGISQAFTALIKPDSSRAARGSQLPRPSIRQFSSHKNESARTKLLDDLKQILPGKQVTEHSGPGRPAQNNDYDPDESFSAYERRFPPVKQRNVWTTTESDQFAQLMLKHDLQWQYYKIQTRTMKQIVQHWAKVIARLRSQKKVAPDSDLAFDKSLWPKIRDYVSDPDLVEKLETWPSATRFSTVPVLNGVKISLVDVTPMPDSTLYYMEVEYQRIKCSQFHDIIILRYLALQYDIEVTEVMVQLLISAQRKAQRLESAPKGLIARSTVRPMPVARDKR